MRSLLWGPGLGLLGLSLTGLGLILLVFYDLLVTCVQAGSGPLSRAAYRPLYAALQALARWSGRRRPLLWSAPLLILGTLFVWVGTLWLGWTLIFWALPGSLIGSDSGEPATFWNTVYYVGYTISTLGLGDLRAPETPARLLSNLAALSGFITITFAITFIVPVAQARRERRELALQLHRSGPGAQRLVLGALQDHPRGLQSLITELHPTLNTLDAKHHHAPYLHLFHDEESRGSLSLALPALAEALLLIEHALPGPPPPGLRFSHQCLDSLTRAHCAAHPGARAPVPPPPSLAPLREAGLETRSEEEFAARLAPHAEYRQRLHAMVTRDHRRWEEVAEPRG